MIEQITKQFKSRDLEMDEANRGLEETRSASATNSEVDLPSQGVAPSNNNTPPPTPSPNSIGFEDLLNKPIPIGKKVLCKVVRVRGAKLNPTYELYLEGHGGRQTFLLNARKVMSARTSNYRISSIKNDFSKTEKGYRGKLRANFVGTMFTSYSKGLKPDENKNVEGGGDLRKEYESNVIGFNGPRKMTILAPGITEKGESSVCIPKSEDESLYEEYKKENPNILILQNKTPQWSDEAQSFVLNFGGRVTHASVKNFQIISERDPDYIVMQFGRTGDDSFSLDFQFPFSALQAFSVALSSFDGKLACE